MIKRIKNIMANSATVLSSRLDRVEQDIERITRALEQVNSALTQMVKLATETAAHDRAIGRAHDRLDEIGKVIHGGNGYKGILVQLESMQTSLTESTLFRRLITTALIAEAIALIASVTTWWRPG